MARRNGEIGAMFRRRMDELGLHVKDVSARAQVGSATYDLVESADDIEFHDVWPLWMIKRVVAALQLDLLDVLGLKCVFCAKDLERWRDLAGLPRNEIIRRRREELGLSQEDLLAKIGWTERFAQYSGPGSPNREWVESTMRKHRTIEDRPDSIEEFTLDEVTQVAAGIEVPPQLLLGARCDRCSQVEGSSEPSGD